MAGRGVSDLSSEDLGERTDMNTSRKRASVQIPTETDQTSELKKGKFAKTNVAMSKESQTMTEENGES